MDGARSPVPENHTEHDRKAKKPIQLHIDTIPLRKEEHLAEVRKESDLVTPSSRTSIDPALPTVLRTTARVSLLSTPPPPQARPPSSLRSVESPNITVSSLHTGNPPSVACSPPPPIQSPKAVFVDAAIDTQTDHELQELRELVWRQSNLLRWYHEKYPQHNPSELVPLTTLELELEVKRRHDPFRYELIFEVARTAFRSYDEKLGDMEAASKANHREILDYQSTCESVRKENAILKSQSDELHRRIKELNERTCHDCREHQSQIDLLKDEVLQLTAEIKRNEPIVTRASDLQKQALTLTSHLTSLQNMVASQSESIQTLTDQALKWETEYNECSGKLSRAVSSNKQLLSRSIALEKMFGEMENKLLDYRRELDRRKKWIKENEGIVEEYKSCIEEFEIGKGLVTDTNKALDEDRPLFRGLLKAHIKRLYRNIEDLRRQLESQDKRSFKLESSYNQFLRKYMHDVDEKDTLLEVGKSHLKGMIQTMERTRDERDAAVQRAESATKETLELSEKLKHALTQRDGEMSGIIKQSNDKMKEIRENYESERMRLHQQIDQLRGEKVELQVEVGQLLRDKRATELELDASKKIAALGRDKTRYEPSPIF
ncbi:uncharacterized protein BJ171DRAFT_596773 [Polychytrium aggregatum]|uniref:uncharacterized protein n=1 Tax=Polychytrium aggregatum TaxID=110093 RepID=UPI0022FEB59E|nr:uncharacterized protein BJ171DRAFT_596773 [Polychytrium aggregatum]KAI9207191.1 hypothetical protein BJ171DRAFT_596773 [Polychytrium aggregatum]